MLFLMLVLSTNIVLAQNFPDYSGDDKNTSHVNASLLNLIDSAGKNATTQLMSSNLQAYEPEVINGKVLVDVVAASDLAAIQAALSGVGMEETGSHERITSGWLPLSAIDDVAAMDGIIEVRPSLATTNVGLVTSQGDAAMNTDLLKATYGLDGTGITIGTLSNSYDCLGDAAASVAAGDLPAGVVVLEEDSVCAPSFAIDEGRGMMELIHDVAPGANQAFHTAFNGITDFALGILELRALAGADIIVDDVIYFAEPMFADGIVAQAADIVKADGGMYFSSAGNNGRNAWEDTYESSGQFFGPWELHNFGGGDPLMDVTLGNGTTIFSFQWNDAYASTSLASPGASTDLDVLVFFNGSFFNTLSGLTANLGADPVEILGISATGSPTIEVAIGRFAGTDTPEMKMVWFDQGPTTIDEYATNSGSVYGHANAAGAIAVGAARYDATPRFGVNPPVIEGFSSAGNTPILRNIDGTPTNEVRNKPEITGPQGTNTTFFGSDYEGDGFPNFFGTSASAPHAAAGAALLKQAGVTSSDDILALMVSTAIDMDDPFTPAFDNGFDTGTGAGLIDIGAAYLTLDNSPPVCGDISLEYDNGKIVAAQQQPSDLESGIASIKILKTKNSNTTLNGTGPYLKNDVETFDPLSQTAVLIRGEKIKMNRGASILTEVTNGAGLTSICDPVVTSVTAELPEVYGLDQNYPNPFNPTTAITFQIPEDSNVRIEVYDMTGRVVSTLINNTLSAGTYEATWDGRNMSGQTVSSGVYMYKMTAGSYIETRVMSLVK